jgi:hypothetical protein
MHPCRVDSLIAANLQVYPGWVRCAVDLLLTHSGGPSAPAQAATHSKVLSVRWSTMSEARAGMTAVDDQLLIPHCEASNGNVQIAKPKQV